MTLIETSRERVANWLDKFRERYVDVERVEDRMALSPDGYEANRRRIETGANGGAGLWVTNDA